MASLPFLQNAPISPGLFKILPEPLTHAIFAFDAHLSRRVRLDGPSYHNLLAKCIDNDRIETKDTNKLLRNLAPAGLKQAKHLDKASQEARQLMQNGMWIAGWQGEAAPPGPSCPQVLFGYGQSRWNWPWVAVFNSRKSKLVKPDGKWLAALRSWLPKLASTRAGIASSFSTYSYDLPVVYAKSAGLPLLIVSPLPLSAILAGKHFPFSSKDTFPYVVLTCQTNALNCSKPTRMVCRDRLLAFIADIHWVLEIRSNGNLHRILHAQHEKQPRHLMILHPNNKSQKNAGNFQLLEAFPSAEAVTVPDEDAMTPSLQVVVDENRQPPHEKALITASEPTGSEWHRYLYHYTRSCPGPWPDQSYEDYLFSLFRKERFCGHTALDTLIRILSGGRIRASKKLVKGEQAVISWSAVPPIELQKLRQWNPALIRWTFESYGIAVRRRLAKEKGVRPVIYGREPVYARLRQADRFRYQRHEPPGCSWKHEREWRLAGDFELHEVSPKDGFIFVSDPADKEFLHYQVECRLPVVVLAHCTRNQDGQSQRLEF